MKKDISNMITTFKLFEAISTSDIKPAYLMTLSEYNEKVAPVLKSFWKFINKNSDALRKADYYGVLHYDFNQYMEAEKDSWEKSSKQYDKGTDWDKSFSKKYAIEKWPDGLTNLPSSQVKNELKEYMDFFKLVFGEKNITRIEKDENKSNKRAIKRAIDDDTYLDLLKSEEISLERLTEIFDSAGVKVPSGLLKRVNLKPIVKIEEKTPEQIQKIFNYIKRILTEFIKYKVNSYQLVTRMTRSTYGISYANVNSFKYIVDNWNFLSDEQKKEIGTEFPDYINKIKEFAGKIEQKTGVENISTDKFFGPIIQKFKDGIQDFIDEYKKEMEESIHENYERKHKDFTTLTGTEFQEKYGMRIMDRKGVFVEPPKYTLDDFWKNELHQILWVSEDKQSVKLKRYITLAQDAYQMREHMKVDALFMRLKMKYPNLIDFDLEKPKRGKAGVEFVMKGYDSEGVIYDIITNTIYAGGYNIQRLHFRWLMNVWLMDKKVAVFKSES